MRQAAKGTMQLAIASRALSLISLRGTNDPAHAVLRIDWAQLFAGNSLPVVTRAALIVLLACLFFIHASMSVPGDFCAVVFHVPAHARGHDDNASCNVCWLLSVAVFRVFSASPFSACWLLSVSHHPRVPCTRPVDPRDQRRAGPHHFCP